MGDNRGANQRKTRATSGWADLRRWRSERAGCGTQRGRGVRLATHVWQTRAALPTAVLGAGVATGPDGKVYVAGGMNFGVPLNALQVYDPLRNVWTQGPADAYPTRRPRARERRRRKALRDRGQEWQWGVSLRREL